MAIFTYPPPLSISVMHRLAAVTLVGRLKAVVARL